MFNAIRRLMASPFGTGGGMSGSFEAAGHGRRLRGFNPPRQHINQAIQAAGRTLVQRARYLVENEPLAGHAVDAWASNTIGDGILPNPAIADPGLKAEAMDLWWRWTEEADADGVSDFYGLQERIAREVFVAGECFVRLLTCRRGESATVPLRLQLLPSEMLDLQFSMVLEGGGVIRQGVEFDARGARVAYHFWARHPDDQVFGATDGTSRIRVPAKDVLHVFEARQAGQIRGVSKFARALVTLFTFAAYDDAELERKKTAAMFAGFVTTPPQADAEATGPLGAKDRGDGTALAQVQPGMLVPLEIGEDIKFSNPADVGNSYEQFQYRQALKIAVGLGIPYAILTGDMLKANYSNQRAALLDFRRRISQWQFKVLVHQAARPIWLRWIALAQVAGAMDLPGYAVNPLPYQRVEWLPPRFEWIDPLKDGQAEVLLINNRLKSRSQSISERGYDPAAVDLEIAADQARERALGIGAPANPAGKAITPPRPEDQAAEAGEDVH